MPRTRYRGRIDPNLNFGEARERLRRITASTDSSADAPLWLDHLAGRKGLGFLFAASLTAAGTSDRPIHGASAPIAKGQ